MKIHVHVNTDNENSCTQCTCKYTNTYFVLASRIASSLLADSLVPSSPTCKYHVHVNDSDNGY